jgi:hypothetical protein
MANERSINYSSNYRGNEMLKRERIPVEWTPELLLEFSKCSEDPIYFCEQYMKVISSDEGLATITLFDYQKDMILSMLNNRFTIIATSRRAGKSTATCAFILWYIIFNPDKTVAILANKGETAREILSKVQFAYQYLPYWLQHGVGDWAKGSFRLENNSRCLAAATSKDAIRGYNVDLLFLDECAHIEKFPEFYASVYPTISQGQTTKVVMVSTPLGLNHFHEIWVNAEKRLNGFHPIKVTWEQVPFFAKNPKWKDETLATLNFDQAKFDQEYGVSWLGSSGSLISGWKLEQLRVDYNIPITDRAGLKQYEKPIKDRMYVCVCDVSEGKGLDYSAFQMIDITTMPYTQAATFKCNVITPIDFAEIIFRTATAYNHAAVLIEVNNMGGQIAEALQWDFEYENLLHTTSGGGRTGKQISFGSSGRLTEKGIRTTKTVKAVGCAIIKLLVEQDKLLVRDLPTIQEFTTFCRKGKSYEAEKGKYDDLVMCLVLFAWLTDQSYFKDLNDINTMARLREKTEDEMMQELMPFGFINNGIDDPEDPTPVEPIARGNWLFPDEWENQ